MKEKKEKKPRIKKMKGGSKVTAHSILFIILSLILTFGLFLGLIFAQNYLSEEITYQQILVAKQEIPVGMIITKENAANYLEFKQVNVLDISSDNLQSADALLGMKAKVRLIKGEPVMVKDFEDVVSYIEQFENPVEMSIAAPEASNADGGKLRAGDMINITLQYSNDQLIDNSYDTGLPIETDENSSYSWFEPFELYGMENKILGNEESESNTTDSETNEETQEVDNSENASLENSEEPANIGENKVDEAFTSPVKPVVPQASTMKATSKAYNFQNQYAYLLEGVYIHKALDANGNEISPADTESVANILVLIIDRSAEIELNEMLENGASMRISKIIDKEKYLSTLEENKANAEDGTLPAPVDSTIESQKEDNANNTEPGDVSDSDTK